MRLCVLVEAIEQAGYKAGEQDFPWRLDVASNGNSTAMAVCLRWRQLYRPPEMVDQLEAWVSRYPDRGRRRRPRRGRLEGFGPCLSPTLGSRVQLVGDDLFRDQHHRPCSGVIEEGDRQFDPDQGEPESALLPKPCKRSDLAWQGGYTSVIAIAGGETEDTTIADWRRPPGPARSRTGSSAAANGWRNTTACCASKTSSQSRRSTRGGLKERRATGKAESRS